MKHDRPLPNNEANRKRQERLRVKRAGLKRIPVFLYPDEATAFREKAVREGWSIAFLPSVRVRAVGDGAVVALTSLFVAGAEAIVVAQNPKAKKSKKKPAEQSTTTDHGAEDIPGQSYFWSNDPGPMTASDTKN